MLVRREIRSGGVGQQDRLRLLDVLTRLIERVIELGLHEAARAHDWAAEDDESLRFQRVLGEHCIADKTSWFS